MPSPELAVVIEMLKSQPPVAGQSVAEMRASMDAVMGAAPAPADVQLEAVSAGGVPAEWTTPEAARRDRAVVYFHGGGYCIGSIASHRAHVANLARTAGLRALSVGYRLAPEDPFPAAVEDAVAAYRYALDTGLEPERVALAGDSAGGGLALAAALAIRDRALPAPAAVVGLSAWTDLTVGGESMRTVAERDPMVREEGLRTMAAAYLAGADARTPLASPLFAPLAGLPPLLLQVGTADVLLDDSRGLAERARREGVDVTLRVWEDMIHVWHAFAPLLPEGQQAVEEIAEFLAKRLA